MRDDELLQEVEILRHALAESLAKEDDLNMQLAMSLVRENALARSLERYASAEVNKFEKYDFSLDSDSNVVLLQVEPEPFDGD